MYRVYVTDGLHEIVGNYKGRYYDIITGNLPEPEPEKTGEEIVAEVMANGGLQFEE